MGASGIQPRFTAAKLCYGPSRMARPSEPSDHFDGLEFRNLDGAPTGGSLRDVLRWKLFGGSVPPWPEHAASNTVAPRLPARVNPGEMAATFVGHSTFLFQFPGGRNVLTDPVWSDRVSPVTFAGPKRVRPPALAFADLPPIQTVLVSHGHYDHLDLTTLRRLEARFRPRFVVGLGNRKFLRSKGLENVEELDWWQDCTLVDRTGADEAWKVTFAPAQHWSARSFTRRNTTLWGSFFLQPSYGQGPRVYFAADSGLGNHFASIHTRLGAPDLSFLPIGAYEPRWFMKPQHMNPEDAVRAHLALGSKRSVGMHFGTFRLTDEGIDEPAAALSASLRAHGVELENFVVPKFGETILLRADV